MFEELFESRQQTAMAYQGIPGIVIGLVKENWDEKQQGKVKVEYYLGEKGKMVSSWIPVMNLYAAPSCGMYFQPEVGSLAVVAFIGGRLDCPLVLGTMWEKGADIPKKTAGEKNWIKSIKTKGGNEIRFSDEDKKENVAITTPSGLNFQLDDEKKTITLQDKDKKNTWILNTEKGEMTLKAEKKLTISIGGSAVVTVEKNSVSIKSGTVSVEGSQSLKMKGQTSSLSGSQVQLKADATLKAEASGMTQIKGAMVKIN